MFFRKKSEAIPVQDVQAEAVAAIIKGAQVLPSKRFSDAIYMALLDHRDMSVADLEALANRLSRLAWNRGRK